MCVHTRISDEAPLDAENALGQRSTELLEYGRREVEIVLAAAPRASVNDAGVHSVLPN
jgi:hypothetical protein